MLFNSFEFPLFLIFIVIVYYAIPHRFRINLLLVASYFFYALWKLESVAIIGGMTIAAYLAAIQIEKRDRLLEKTGYFVFGLLFSLGPLLFFKYVNFFGRSMQSLLALLHISFNFPLLNILLPIGISFYTLQIVGYLIDVYRGEHKAERNFSIFALYVSFFPKLLSGPIERAGDFLPQLHKKYNFDEKRITEGLKLILWGLFKKIVIANRLAIYVNAVYGNYTHHTGTSLLVATFFFAVQLYNDFSGYTDIAIGSAKIMGFQLTENFQRPFFSRSVTEFWRRWHISLSSWCRDYIYVPLTIYKRYWNVWGVVFALMVTFSILGLWHGSAWHFVIFGFLHGMAISIEILTRNFRKRLNKVLYPAIYSAFNMACTFVFFCFTLVFFRAKSVVEALDILKKILFMPGNLFLGGIGHFLYCIFVVILIFVVELKSEFFSDKIMFLNSKNIIIRYMTYLGLVILMLLIGVFNESQFIYFQF